MTDKIHLNYKSNHKWTHYCEEPSRFTKAGSVWFGGARKTRWAMSHGPCVTMEWLLAKRNSHPDLPAFLGPYGIY